jgi:metal-responsive CopG/Arc/MetJ family transcriptional regulator
LRPLCACVYDVWMQRFQMFLPEPLVRALKALAKRTDMSVAEHIRRAITEYLQRNR